jgi:cell division protein FtsB
MPRPDKKPVVRRPWVRWALLALFLLMAYQVMTGPRGLLKVADLRAQKKQILWEIDSLEARREELLAEQKRLLTDTVYLEKLARKELGMARPGEKVYRFVAPAARADSAR